MGEAVRYDGADAKSELPHAALDGVFRFCGICPEVAIGMGVPRPPIRLVGDRDNPQALRIDAPDIDVAEDLRAFAQTQAGRFDGLFGYIFMERSPSCGLFSVKLRTEVRGEPWALNGRGVYAQAVVQAWPGLPVEENGRLRNAALRDAFVQRVFTYAHWRLLVGMGLTPQRLTEFHARHKYLLMAHSPAHCRDAGRLLSNLGHGMAAIGTRYLDCLMDGLSRPATAGGHANALSHMQGYLKRCLTQTETRRITEAIERCRTGATPVQQALSLIWEQLQRHPNAYLQKQVYFEPTLARKPDRPFP